MIVRLREVFGALLLVVGVAGALTLAMAQEGAGWHGEAGTGGASLSYRLAQADNATLSFSCTPGGDGLTFVFAFVPDDPFDSAEVEVVLQAGGIAVPIRTTGMHRDAAGALFVLEGRTALDDRLAALITSEGTLAIVVGDEAADYPLEGAREAAAPLLKACAGQSVEAGPAGATICRMRAWSTDPDPEGQNVRAGPGTRYAVIGRLPPPQAAGNDGFATEVSIVGSRDGWFRIDAATVDNHVGDGEPVAVFEGDGWVSGRLLGLSVEGSLFAAPSRRAPLVLDLAEMPERRQGPDYTGPELERLHACMGDWAEVEMTDFGRRVRGWTDDICASQVTTCP